MWTNIAFGRQILKFFRENRDLATVHWLFGHNGCLIFLMKVTISRKNNKQL